MSAVLLTTVIVIGTNIIFSFFWVCEAKVVRKIRLLPSHPYAGHFLDSGMGRRMQPANRRIFYG